MDKLIYLSTAYLPSRSAHSVHVMKMASAFSAGTASSVVLTGFLPKELNDINIFEYYNVPQNFVVRRFKNRIGRLYSLVMAMKVFYFRADNTVFYTRNTLIAFFLSLAKQRFFYEIHDFFPSVIRRVFEKNVVNSSFMIKCYVISEGLKEDFENYYLGNSCAVLHDGADISLMKERFEKRGKTVGYVGSLYSGRGLDLILTLAGLRPDYNFLVVGGSPEQVRRYEQMAKTIFNCKFVGHVSQTNLLEYYSQMDILLMPYSPNLKTDANGINTARWMSPLKLFEYMSTGIPIVSSDLPTIKEIVNGEEVELLVYNDVKEWQMTLDKIFGNYSFYLNRSIDLRQRFENGFTWGQRAKKILGEL